MSYKYDRSLSAIQNRIIELLSHGSPMKKSLIAKELGVTFQTISSHINKLELMGHVTTAYRDGNAVFYQLSDKYDGLPRINWNGESVAIRDKVRSTIESHTPVANPYLRRIFKVLAEFYKLSANAVENDERIPLATLKNMQVELFNTHKNIKHLAQIFEDLLNNPNLWDPMTLPRELLIRDPEMSTELALSIHETLLELIGEA